MRYYYLFCTSVVFVGLLFLVGICSRDIVVRGAPTYADCHENRDYTYNCVADEKLFTCVPARDSGFLHLVINCAPVKGCR